jgi:LmbE family N-acetylglucosaminyl deacetylase
LRDPLGQPVNAEFFIDISDVLARKREALAAHASQKEWLDISQGMDSYLKAMEDMSREVGRMSQRFRFAEGWRRHLPAGFCAEQADPLQQALRQWIQLNPDYKRRRGRR